MTTHYQRKIGGGLVSLPVQQRKPGGGLHDVGGRFGGGGTTPITPPTPPVGATKLFRGDVAYSTPIRSAPVLDPNDAAISGAFASAPQSAKVVTVNIYASSRITAAAGDRKFKVGDAANPMTIRNNSFGPTSGYRNKAVYVGFPAAVFTGGVQHQFVISTAGTTAGSAPSFAGATSYGQTVQDGNATWKHAGSFSTGGPSYWGDNRLNGPSIPVPNAAAPSPGTDGHLIIIDPTSDTAYDLWQTVLTRDGAGNVTGVLCSYGSVDPLSGDGRATYGVFSASNPWEAGGQVNRPSGSGINVAWGDMTWAELDAALTADLAGDYVNATCGHALHFASDITEGPQNDPAHYRYPATTTDGTHTTGTTIKEGTRVQYQQTDAAINAMANPFHRIIARTLKVYGAYCSDTGGARFSCSPEYGWSTAMQATMGRFGFASNFSDYVALPLDYSKLHALRAWDGT